ncbi:hypothetical protein ONS95_014941 [Cadophora gregata]|uniref:uncharacterized protein n=1 Tax=Cadophora gregata TaxID=51156 RepID=UPI0026DD3CBA|nr:uncharacterized protein ONS95_014941 [Cadophora gregata]KAK0103141.1 hypothetical protein ONS96_005750 [Cadophora gregata f. sp. sojae]KAK0113245.1 hypothetical protein ONS95_014941 [Cadophora gregata]
MSTRKLYLIASRNSAKQRAHFSIFIPSISNPDKGTAIHVVGAPMAGYMLEFKRHYSPAEAEEKYEMWRIGETSEENVKDFAGNEFIREHTPRDNLEREATRVPPPRISENFRAPVNDTTNRRCQEWTMDFLHHLVLKGFISQEADDIVQSKRDPPSHGIV